MIYTYCTDFTLTNPVNDFEAAQAYLTDDDMTKYWKRKHEQSKVIKIQWDLTDEQTGHIVVITNDELTSNEANELSNWIRGQNSDGLGEGFEQQDFAWISYDDEEDEGEMASFDWDTNDYKLVLISKV